MRKCLEVQIPLSEDFSYTLYAQGLNIDIPREQEDGSYITFRFAAETVTALFYTFGNFRRAYLVTPWQDEKDGEQVHLPGIEQPLYIIFKAKGKKIDELKHTLNILTREDMYAPFRTSIEFWIKLSNMIEYHGSHKEEVFFLYNKYQDKK